jgi:hypothetical protein
MAEHNITSEPARAAEDQEFYVGYLPVPRRQLTFLRWGVPLTLWLLCGVSFLWMRSQTSPGPAVWEDATPVTLSGTIVAKPYPILFTSDAKGVAQGVMLVEVGKHGSSQRADAYDGRNVKVSGWPLHRDGRRILELEPLESAITADDTLQSPSFALPKVSLGTITLRGEIVDSKCYLGAMKPGEGKTHKECAILCVRGGIPPMFVNRDTAGRVTCYVLQDASGGPIDPALYPLIADPVELTGELMSWGGLKIISIRADGVKRL